VSTILAKRLCLLISNEWVNITKIDLKINKEIRNYILHEENMLNFHENNASIHKIKSKNK